MPRITELMKIPVCSTAFEHGVDMHFDGGVATLRFDYVDIERDGKFFRSGLKIIHPKATSHRVEVACRPEHVNAYDTLVEVRDSEWLRAVVADIAEGWKDKWELHHYRIYFASDGCYEYIAESWEALPEEPGTWT